MIATIRIGFGYYLSILPSRVPPITNRSAAFRHALSRLKSTRLLNHYLSSFSPLSVHTSFSSSPGRQKFRLLDSGVYCARAFTGEINSICISRLILANTEDDIA